jgi:peptidoglycan hydrolase-like protein with peptidoglycan-binding domain
VIRWGEDYEGRTDPMHFEIIGTVAQVNAVWQAMKGGSGIVPAAASAGRPTIAKGATGQAVKDLQAKLKADYPLYAKALVVDGDFGAKTDAAVREFQRRAGLVVDGIVGPKTWAKLGL